MPNTERLPRWNLQKSFGYSSPSDPQIDKDLASYRRFCRGFAHRYKGKVAGLSDEELVRAIERYHAGDDLYTRLSNYATMAYERQRNDPTIKQLCDKVYRKLSEAGGLCVYFEEELTNLSKERWRAFKRNRAIDRKYKTYVEQHVLSKHDLVSTAQADAVGIFSPLLDDFQGLHGQITSNQRFAFGGETLDYDTMRARMNYSHDPEVREAALGTFIKTIAPARITYETIMNAGLRYRANHQDLYNYAHPTDQWNVENDITDHRVPLRMLDAVVRSGVTQRFYGLKARLMGKSQLDPWDISAPIPEENGKRYSWSEAREIVVASFTHFHPHLGAIAKKAFDEGWIDAPPSKGKYTGFGITYEGSKQIPPHVLVNWRGNFNSLVTLAHEVGHAVAMHTQKEKLGNILSSQPKMVAELCALFAERMLAEEMERRAKTPQEKLLIKYQVLSSHSMYAMINAHGYGAAVDLQTQYNKSRRRRVSADELDSWSLNISRQLYGDAVRNIEKRAPMWVADEQQFYDPFYLGDYPMVCLATQVLFDKRRSGEIGNLPDRFIRMLHKGGLEDGLSLMKGLGADITEPGFWNKGIRGIQRDMDELEKMMEQGKGNKSRASRFVDLAKASRNAANRSAGR